ncbi:hypothetical protein [Stygiolobus caldivivus]|uniref:Uncharacterized protein n=1 Tax=Stygiolobus caldivivus TaxID=2824673 RepID=A0A8D5U729_9CREN|nr:hypothetical protein [Stygiolobus caldivivus]BCU70422.1 hypothetical protein KN1_17190 [Stygiolobus caldivivus]
MPKKGGKPKKRDTKLTPVYSDALDELNYIVNSLLNVKHTSLNGKSDDENPRTAVLSDIIMQVAHSLKVTRNADILEYLSSYLLLSYLIKLNRRGFLRVPLSVFTKLDKNIIDEILLWYKNVTLQYADSVKGLIQQKDIITESDIQNLLDKTPLLSDISPIITVNKDQNANQDKFYVTITIQGSTGNLTQGIGEILKNFLDRMGFKIEEQRFFEDLIEFLIST